MPNDIAPIRHAKCACGMIVLELAGAPILTVACYCRSCQVAAERMISNGCSSPILDEQNGTHFVMQRKDRVRCLQGGEQLQEFRLTPESKSVRYIASCCNSPMFLELHHAHWLSVFKDRIAPAEQPALEQRTMTASAPAGTTFNDAIPSPKKHTVSFMWKLLTAWVAMGFKDPKIDFSKEVNDG